MAIRVVLLDMDGTFLGRSQVAVSVRNMTAMQQALARGITVVPCTGRVFDMLPPQVLTQQGLRYFVTSHGARVYDRAEKRDIYTDLIPPEGAAQLMRLLQGQNLYNEIAAAGTIFLEAAVAKDLAKQPVPEHHIWYMQDRCYTAVADLAAYFSQQRLGVEKMNLYGIPQQLWEKIYAEVTATGLVSHTRPGAGANLEFLHATLDKKAAVDALLTELGVGYDEVLALGDSSSDLPILRAARMGVAMGNAPLEIQQAADAVTGLNIEDGVAEALEKYL